MNFSEWKDSLLISVGDNLTKPRSTIQKAKQAGIGLMIAVAASSALPAQGADQKSAALSYEEIRESIGPVSKRLTEMYGSSEKIIILHNDENLRYIIANMKPDLMSGYQNVTDSPEKVMALEQLRKESGYENNADEFKKIQLFTDLTKPAGAFAYFPDSYNGIEETQGTEKIAFFKGWSETDNNELSTNFPQYSDKSEQTYFAFFHELTHIVDSKTYNENYTNQLFLLKTESIADVATAMIMLRETGNNDSYNYNIRSLRYALSGDSIHMTVDVADAVLKDITLDQVNHVDDKTLMLMAEKKVNAYFDKIMLPTLQTSNGDKYSEAEYLERKYQGYASAYIDKNGNLPQGYSNSNIYMSSMKGAETSFNDVRNFSRDAMIASLNNLIYHNQVNEHKNEFLSALKNHIDVFDDKEVLNSYKEATKTGHLDATKFVEGIGYKLDVQAFTRKENNDKLMSAYFEHVTGEQLDNGLSMTEIKPNEKAAILQKAPNARRNSGLDMN